MGACEIGVARVLYENGIDVTSNDPRTFGPTITISFSLILQSFERRRCGCDDVLRHICAARLSYVIVDLGKRLIVAFFLYLTKTLN